MNARRGIARLGIGAASLWFLFWTCAYVIGHRASENAPPPSFTLSLQENPSLGPVLVVAGILAATWIAAGFRSK